MDESQPDQDPTGEQPVPQPLPPQPLEYANPRTRPANSGWPFVQGLGAGLGTIVLAVMGPILCNNSSFGGPVLLCATLAGLIALVWNKASRGKPVGSFIAGVIAGWFLTPFCAVGICFAIIHK
jgi:hypothetical protein